MIRPTLLLCLAALPSCILQDPAPESAISAIPVPEAVPDNPEISLDPKSGDGPVTRNNIDENLRPPIPLSVRKTSTGNIKLTILTFDSRNHSLEVLDNEQGPGTGSRTSQSAAQSLNGIAAINGGFFTPEGKPLGLVYEGGNKYGGLSSSSLGSGIYIHHGRSTPPAILPRSSWSRRTTPPAHLLQSGPFLLRNSNPVPGLSTSRPRQRSFLLWNGHSGWALAHSSSTTLASLSKALASQPVPGFHILHALNLDGGSSSDLWVSSQVKGGPVSTRHLWNKNVRNYLVLTPNR